jgi:hypothetical protein
LTQAHAQHQLIGEQGLFGFVLIGWDGHGVFLFNFDGGFDDHAFPKAGFILNFFAEVCTAARQF